MPSDESVENTTAEGTTPEPPVQITSATGKIIPMAQTTINRLKAEEREKGKKVALAEFEAQAQALGFKGFEDMKNALARNKANSNRKAEQAVSNEKKHQPRDDRQNRRPQQNHAQVTQPRQEPVQNSERVSASDRPRVMAKLERENQRLLEEKRRLNSLRAGEEKRRRRLQRELDSQQAEMQLRMAAVGAGIRKDEDVDYALDLLRRTSRGKTAEELKGFDEHHFFSNLREQRPYLFGVEERPAATGQPPAPGQSENRSMAAPAPKSAGNGATGKITSDAMKLTQQEYGSRLRELGIVPPGGSYAS